MKLPEKWEEVIDVDIEYFDQLFLIVWQISWLRATKNRYRSRIPIRFRTVNSEMHCRQLDNLNQKLSRCG